MARIWWRSISGWDISSAFHQLMSPSLCSQMGEGGEERVREGTLFFFCFLFLFYRERVWLETFPAFGGVREGSM